MLSDKYPRETWYTRGTTEPYLWANKRTKLVLLDSSCRFCLPLRFRRIMVAIMTGIGILWIPVVQNVQGGQLFIYIQAVSAYFSPPIAALYLISILWTKATEKVCSNVFLSNFMAEIAPDVQSSGSRGSVWKVCVYFSPYVPGVIRITTFPRRTLKLRSLVAIFFSVHMWRGFSKIVASSVSKKSQPFWQRRRRQLKPCSQCNSFRTKLFVYIVFLSAEIFL